MSETADIPNDIMKSAADAMLRAGFPVRIGGPAHLVIARAIHAERERCLSITEGMLRFADTTSASDEAIAKAIRGTE